MTLTDRVTARLLPYFDLPDSSANNTYLFARTVACPRTGKPIPLAPNWWLSRAATRVAVRLVTERDGKQLDECEFEIVRGTAIDFDPGNGTMRGGAAVSPWDDLAVNADYIKREAKAVPSRMGSVLFAISHLNELGKKDYRPPGDVDRAALEAASVELAARQSSWERANILPVEEIVAGNDPKLLLWRHRWTDMFSDRQLLVHGTFVDEFTRLLPEMQGALPADRAAAVLSLLGLMQGKALDYNSRQCTWDVTRDRVGHGFEEHAFPFRSTHPEFEGARELYPWALEQLLDAYHGAWQIVRQVTVHSSVSV
ncbi:MAG: hypothetical protein WBP81_01385 [Solirubrobacteraceae bacterium]